MSDLLSIDTDKYKSWSLPSLLDVQEENIIKDQASDISSFSFLDQDIDFSQVYTLYTFEATVEGQATVRKGDPLSLLDDSNSYWWLIKNVRTSEFGYIPAENIETPYERLARFNKERNSDIEPVPDPIRPLKAKKKVVLSKTLYFQLQVILTSDDDSNYETIYETWSSDISDSSLEFQNTTQDDSSSQITLTDDTSPCSVLRVYAGNLNVGALYHSIRVTENISADDFLSKTLDKFHIPQIDIHHQKHSVEYYLSLKNSVGEEITLRTEDKPFLMYQTLNCHHTTPMPSLSAHFKNTLKPKKKQSVQFLLHKRIKRKGAGGIVHIKLSILNHFNDPNYYFYSWIGKRKSKIQPERIEKLVAVDGALTVYQLTKLAIEKLYIIPYPPHDYKLSLHTKSRDIVLDKHMILSDILKGLSQDEEKQFVLHSPNDSQIVIHNHQKVYPETSLQVPVTVDPDTQVILKRVDFALSKQMNRPDPLERKFSMSVTRNDRGGIDIHLPHGLIRSCKVENRLQYSLFTLDSRSPIIQNLSFDSLPQNEMISANELEALVKYGSHYLDTLEIKYGVNTIH